MKNNDILIRLQSLEDENRRLKAQLETKDEILAATEEAALKQNRLLHEANEKLSLEVYGRKKAQEELLSAERLAAVGETSGRVAHEVLNPITSVFSRVEQNIGQWKEFSEILGSIREVIGDWDKEYRTGGFLEYLNRAAESGKSYGEEDFYLLKTLLKDAVSFQKQREDDLKFIYKQINRIIKIINALRESARAQRNIAKVNITSIADEAIDTLEDSFSKRNIAIRKDVQPNLFIMADESEMVQVLTNLLRNAMQSIDEKRMESAGKIKDGEVGISAILDKEKDIVQIRIKDTGKGIPKGVRSFLFKFNFSTKDRKEGTGLGLGISRRFVRETGGDIILEESTEGVGTTFLITIPAAGDVPASPPSQSTKSLSENLVAPGFIPGNLAGDKPLEGDHPPRFSPKPKHQIKPGKRIG